MPISDIINNRVMPNSRTIGMDFAYIKMIHILAWYKLNAATVPFYIDFVKGLSEVVRLQVILT